MIAKTAQRYIGTAIDVEHAHLMWKHAVEFRWPGTTPNISVTQQFFPERPIYMKMWYNCIPNKTSRLSLNLYFSPTHLPFFIDIYSVVFKTIISINIAVVMEIKA